MYQFVELFPGFFDRNDQANITRLTSTEDIEGNFHLQFSKAPNILKAVHSEAPMSSSVIVVSEPEQWPETSLYRFDIVIQLDSQFCTSLLSISHHELF